MGKEQYIREMWEYFCHKFREEAEKEMQAGIQGKRQEESPARVR